MIRKLFAVLFCLSVVSVLSFGVVGCDKKDATKKTDEKKTDEKKTEEPKKTT